MPQDQEVLRHQRQHDLGDLLRRAGLCRAGDRLLHAGRDLLHAGRHLLHARGDVLHRTSQLLRCAGAGGLKARGEISLTR